MAMAAVRSKALTCLAMLLAILCLFWIAQEIAFAAPASPAAGEPVYGGILRLANRGDPPSGWDPMRTSSIALHHVAGGVFGAGNLVMPCRENMYMVCPYLATSWRHNADYTEWTFNIRTDVYWHDGHPFTEEDVAFWLELAYFGVTKDGKTRAPAYFKGDLGEIVEIEAGRGQVTIRFAQPTVRFPEMLLDPRIKIAHPAHLMKPRIEAGDVDVSPLDVGLVGVGPFKVASYEPGTKIEVRRFDRYWEKDSRGRRLPYLDGIDFYIMPDPVAMDLAFRAGRIDGGARGEGHYLTSERKAVYERTMGDQVYFVEMGGGMFRLAFNVLRPGPWQDARVRKAILLWLDSEEAIIGALDGMGYYTSRDWPGSKYSPRPFQLWPRFNPRRKELDRAEALRLMEEAGYPNGFTMGYLCRAIHMPRCEFLQQQLAGLKINLVLHIVDEGEWNRARFTLDYDTQSGSNFSGTVPEASESAYGRYSKNPDAYARHEDPVIDQFYFMLRQAIASDQRTSIWRQMERYIVDEQVYVIPIAASYQVVPYRTYVKGIVVPPEDGHAHTDFSTVWLDK